MRDRQAAVRIPNRERMPVGGEGDIIPESRGPRSPERIIFPIPKRSFTSEPPEQTPAAARPRNPEEVQVRTIQLGRADYHDKVHACWLGKNIGGTLGAPFEIRKYVNALTFYDPVPRGRR
jgi:hypothetical protein